MISVGSSNANANSHGDPQHPHASSTLFFNLPREIRDTVYDTLWTAAPRLQVARGRINRGTFEVHYGIPTLETNLEYGLPCWLLTSKTFLEEGMYQLLRVGSWTSRWFPPVVQSQAGQRALINSRLIDLPRVGNITFIVNMVNSVTEDGSEISLPPVRGQTSFAIWRFSPRLKNLTLRAYHDQIVDGTLMRVDANTPWIINLSWLNTSQLSLDSITVRATMWGRSNLEPIAGGLVEAYEDELSRLGLLLVGRDGHLETEKVGVGWNDGGELLPTHAHRLDYVVRFCKKPV